MVGNWLYGVAHQTKKNHQKNCPPALNHLGNALQYVEGMELLARTGHPDDHAQPARR
jgi:hypothetical protein